MAAETLEVEHTPIKARNHLNNSVFCVPELYYLVSSSFFFFLNNRILTSQVMMKSEGFNLD